MTKEWPYLDRFKDRHGKWRYRFRRGRKKAYLPGKPGSAEFAAAYAEALAGEDKPRPSKRAPAGSLAFLIDEYYRSAAYRQLAPQTKRTYESVLDRLRAEHGEKPAGLMDRAFVRRAMSKRAEKPGAANKLLRMIRQLYNFGIEHELVSHNPAQGVRKLKIAGDGFIEWTEEDIKAFKKRWKAGTKQRLALMLALHTGQRRADLALMQWAHIKSGRISVQQAKTKTRLWIKIHSELALELKRHKKRGLFILLTDYEKPFSAEGLGNFFGAAARASGLGKGYNLHGLRKAQGRRLADNGSSAHEIMSVLGHKSLKEAERYTKGADQRRLADAAIGKLSGRTKRENA